MKCIGSKYLSLLLILSACDTLNTELLKGEPGAVGPVGPQGEKGDSGSAGTNGNDGHSAVVKIVDADLSQCSNGGYVILIATDSNDNLELDSDDLNIQSGIVCNGLNAPPTPLTPVLALNPCGDNPSLQDEILLKLSNGMILASFSDNANGLNTRFGLLSSGTFITTDNDHCIFTLDSNGNITYEDHHF